MGESVAVIALPEILALLGIAGAGAALQYLLIYPAIEQALAGVPHDAKTLGAGIQLIQEKDAIDQLIGANLIRMAQHGQAISDGGGPCSPLAKVTAMATQLYNYRNVLPRGGYWQTLHQTATAAVMQLKDILPPKGAPYSDGVTVGTFTIRQPLAAAASRPSRVSRRSPRPT